MTFHIYISSKCRHLFIIFVFGFIFFEVEPFVPRGRLAHSSILVGDRIYFFGGTFDEIYNTDEVFYLDISKSFDVTNPPWVQLGGIPIGSSWATVAYSDPNIYLFGGVMI